MTSRRDGGAARAAASWLLVATTTSAAPPCGGYEVEILPEIHCPGPLPDHSVIVESVNDAGMVTGHYLTHCSFTDLIDEGFTWTSQTGIVTIPRPPWVTSLQAYDISDVGLVVGKHGTTLAGLGYLGFTYDGTRLVNLGTLPGGTSSQSNAVNSAGTVVGWWGNIVTGVPTAGSAFRWEAGVMQDIGPDLGVNESIATDISDSGLITGYLFTESGDRAAFIWNAGRVVVLPPVPGGFTSEGAVISDDGWVAGHGFIKTGPGFFDFVLQPFVWDGTRMILIDHLPGATSSRVTGMNNDHQVIGYVAAGALAEGQTGAFLWSDGVTYDIGDFIKRDGYVLTQPKGINDHGDIVMTGAFDGRGISAVIRPLVADLDCDGVVGPLDVQLILSAWGVCDLSPCGPDLDDNGVVNGFDLALLLASWG